jgi:hypothetical protein
MRVKETHPGKHCRKTPVKADVQEEEVIFLLEALPQQVYNREAKVEGRITTLNLKLPSRPGQKKIFYGT